MNYFNEDDEMIKLCGMEMAVKRIEKLIKNKPMKRDVNELRNHLFAQIERLASNMSEVQLKKEVARAKPLIGLSRVIIESAKAETQFLKAAQLNGKNGNVFFNHTKNTKKITR